MMGVWGHKKPDVGSGAPAWGNPKRTEAAPVGILKRSADPVVASKKKPEASVIAVWGVPSKRAAEPVPASLPVSAAGIEEVRLPIDPKALPRKGKGKGEKNRKVSSKGDVQKESAGAGDTSGVAEAKEQGEKRKKKRRGRTGAKKDVVGDRARKVMAEYRAAVAAAEVLEAAPKGTAIRCAVCIEAFDTVADLMGHFKSREHYAQVQALIPEPEPEPEPEEVVVVLEEPKKVDVLVAAVEPKREFKVLDFTNAAIAAKSKSTATSASSTATDIATATATAASVITAKNAAKDSESEKESEAENEDSSDDSDDDDDDGVGNWKMFG
jgi:hypothetical protein